MPALTRYSRLANDGPSFREIRSGDGRGALGFVLQVIEGGEDAERILTLVRQPYHHEVHGIAQVADRGEDPTHPDRFRHGAQEKLEQAEVERTIGKVLIHNPDIAVELGQLTIASQAATDLD